MKQDFENINKKIVDWKDFVFFYSLLLFGTIGKPVHIAHICKLLM